MTTGSDTSSAPVVRLLEDRVGKRLWRVFDAMTSKSLRVTKAVDIGDFCPNRRGRYPVRLEYYESGNGVGVRFQDDIPKSSIPWKAFASQVQKLDEVFGMASIRILVEEVGISTDELSRVIMEHAPEPTGSVAFLVVPTTIGFHTDVVDAGPDINGFAIVICHRCGTSANNEEDLEKTPCNWYCRNCQALRRSYDREPAVPENGSCNSRLHICPYDGNRWWQSNEHYHLWQQITSDSEWEALKSERPGPGPDW